MTRSPPTLPVDRCFAADVVVVVVGSVAVLRTHFRRCSFRELDYTNERCPETNL